MPHAVHFALMMGWIAISGVSSPTEPQTTLAPRIETPALGLRVTIDPTGYTVHGEEPSVCAGVLLPCIQEGCPTAASYDTEGLVALLHELKSAHPDEDRIVLVPAPETAYSVIVYTLAVVREDGDPLFPFVSITTKRAPDS